MRGFVVAAERIPITWQTPPTTWDSHRTRLFHFTVGFTPYCVSIRCPQTWYSHLSTRGIRTVNDQYDERVKVVGVLYSDLEDEMFEVLGDVHLQPRVAVLAPVDLT